MVCVTFFSGNLGAANFLAASITAQVIASIYMDHFGVMGLVKRQVTLTRGMGGVMMVIGTVILTALR